MTTRRRRVEVPRVSLRPQSVLLGFFGDYVSDPSATVASTGVVELLGAAGVGEHAARQTLNRMVQRGLLRRRTAGRHAYFGLTDFGRRTVADGRERTHRPDVTDQRWDGAWTFVSYSLPEDAQRERHELRARLAWAGFGLVQAGLWCVPRRVDVADVVDDPRLAACVTAFEGVPRPPTTGPDLVRQAYDLSSLRDGYRDFRQRWAPLVEATATDVDDALVARVVLTTDWLQVIRDDPRLPAELLPSDWPGARARTMYLRLDDRLRPHAEEQARLLVSRDAPARDVRTGTAAAGSSS